VAGADITQGLPRVEELFEARPPKYRAVIAEAAGKVKVTQGERRIIETPSGEKVMDVASGGKVISLEHTAVEEEKHALGENDKAKVKDGAKVKAGDVLFVSGKSEILAEHDGVVKLTEAGLTVVYQEPAVIEYQVPTGYQVLVKDGAEVQPGDALTEGHMDLLQLFRLKGKDAVMLYLLREVLAIYASQGQKINAKHIEVMIRQMFSRVYVKDSGDTDLLPGEVVEKMRSEAENKRVADAGGKQAELEELFLGVTKVSLSTESFLSAASFQETARVLINAAVTGKIDRLEGLKENVIIGRLIPAGTGFGAYTEESLAAMAAAEEAEAEAKAETV
jgi:DNA-directed RNA polymerase subunit beta'